MVGDGGKRHDVLAFRHSCGLALKLSKTACLHVHGNVQTVPSTEIFVKTYRFRFSSRGSSYIYLVK